ncbi:hypothetical protein BGX38DRAFT_1143050 [Terfezia claveryi]|nr:hypothetical protein BGX38DRAFT_1143050 [Terfezia claveryi]
MGSGTIRGLEEDEVTQLKERLVTEKKRNNVLRDTNIGLIEDRRNTVAEEKFERIANFLADTIRSRPVETLIGAVKDHLEKLEVRSKEDPKFRDLKSETLRKTEKMKKVEEINTGSGKEEVGRGTDLGTEGT